MCYFYYLFKHYYLTKSVIYIGYARYTLRIKGVAFRTIKHHRTAGLLA